MTSPAMTAGGKLTRRRRRDAAARRAPWGPAAPRSVVVRRPGGPRLRIDYLLRHGRGASVTTPDGARIGSVEGIVARPYDFWPQELLVRAESGEQIRIDAQRVLRAYPREERLVVESS